MRDSQGRVIEYARISLTEACRTRGRRRPDQRFR